MILFLHGFRSSPASWKARALRDCLAGRGLEDAFWCEQLPASPQEAIALIEDRIAACPTLPTLVGSSLGGFYATWLAERHGCKAVLVNPAVLAPPLLAQYVGTHKNLHTGARFELTPAHVNDLRTLEVAAISHPERYWLLAETGDEVLDYRVAVARYAGARQTILEGGGHGFTRWKNYLAEIAAFAGLP
ncbi:MAG: alpha/beta fold hydrolase [Azoarcus sp.]|jgi:predicted esterase YcpF (UPF0227 family)|nr:alpha/beta fold hydrolase [Azoarcus sp.]